MMTSCPGSISQEDFEFLLTHAQKLTPCYGEFDMSRNVMRLGHVLAQSGDLELLTMMPVSELMADKRGWNAAHYAAKGSGLQPIFVGLDRFSKRSLFALVSNLAKGRKTGRYRVLSRTSPRNCPSNHSAQRQRLLPCK